MEAIQLLKNYMGFIPPPVLRLLDVLRHVFLELMGLPMCVNRQVKKLKLHSLQWLKAHNNLNNQWLPLMNKPISKIKLISHLLPNLSENWQLELYLTSDVMSNVSKHATQALLKLLAPLPKWMLKLSIVLKQLAALPQTLSPLVNLFKPILNANSTKLSKLFANNLSSET